MYDEFYLYVCNTDSMNLYGSNKPSNFLVNLPKRYNLEGVWVCGLKEIYCELSNNSPDIININYTGCESSFVRGTYSPLLRMIPLLARRPPIVEEKQKKINTQKKDKKIITGTTSAEKLPTVSKPPEKQFMRQTFTSPIYIRMITHELDTINISITDANGLPAELVYAMITIHFKRL